MEDTLETKPHGRPLLLNAWGGKGESIGVDEYERSASSNCEALMGGNRSRGKAFEEKKKTSGLKKKKKKCGEPVLGGSEQPRSKALKVNARAIQKEAQGKYS